MIWYAAHVTTCNSASNAASSFIIYIWGVVKLGRSHVVKVRMYVHFTVITVIENALMPFGE